MTTIRQTLRWQPTGWARWWGGVMLAASVLLSGCVTDGYPGGGYPDAGYPGTGYPGEQGSERLLATVQEVDVNDGRLLLTADSGAYAPGGYGTSRIEVFFDRNTQLVYQGRVVAIEGLERGDRISVDAVQSQGRWWARRIEVVQNVRDAPGGSYGGELRGAVSYVDPRARLITLTRGGYSGSREEGSREQVYYDERTQVEYRGQWFRPEQLDPGDVVRIQTRPLGDGWMAERIFVEVDANSR